MFLICYPCFRILLFKYSFMILVFKYINSIKCLEFLPEKYHEEKIRHISATIVNDDLNMDEQLQRYITRNDNVIISELCYAV